MPEDRDYHFNKLPGKTYMSRRLFSFGQKLRIASKVFDSEDGLAFATELSEEVLRVTPAGRQEIVAKFMEDDRGVFILTIQKFNDKSGPSKRDYFSFRGKEIPRLLEFLLNIKRVHLPTAAGINISDEELRELLLSTDQTRQLISGNSELVATIVANEFTASDIVALGYRRTQLKLFERLLSDDAFFDSEAEQVGREEAVWQRFFEANKWIFGYGLSYVFLSGLDNERLEQTVRGHSFAGVGKRADALMKTRALVSSLCFVEIKTHRTPLLAQTVYRPGVWRAHAELAGGVSQAQVTVNAALDHVRGRIETTNSDGSPTGEVLFNIEPRAFLVVGSLNEFQTVQGVNEEKYQSFELFRRNVRRPEIITFDELFQRAQFIVGE